MQSVERNVTLPTDPDETWSLITDADDLSGWLGDEVSLVPVPGAAGELVDGDGTRRRLVVDEVEHGARLAWHWWIDGDSDGDELDVVSRVEITLTPAGTGTRVDVVERQAYASLRADVSCAGWWHRLLDLELLALCRHVALVR